MLQAATCGGCCVPVNDSAHWGLSGTPVLLSTAPQSLWMLPLLLLLLRLLCCRYNPQTGDLTIACDRFPTREENRRWCLEVLHRLLQTAQGRHPSKDFWVDSSVIGVPAGHPLRPAASQ